MNEDFVPYELAVKLKEKGFKQFCSHYYKTKCKDLFMVFPSEDWSDTKERINAPTISQVLKWLRKEKKIHIEPCILADKDIDADGKVINEYTYWSFSVTHIETGDMIYFEYESIEDKRFDSYEQAALAGIEYVIDNLI